MSDASKDATADAAESQPAALGDIPLMLFIRGLGLFAAVLALVGWLHAYLGHVLIDGAGVAPPVASALWVGVWALYASMPAGFLAGRALPRALARPLQWLSFGWMGAFGLLLSLAAASGAGLWVAERFWALPAEVPAWRAGALVGVTLLLLAVGAVVARRPALRRVEVPLHGLGPALDGFRIVQLSDIHIGETLGRSFAEALVARVNALAPDLVVITGDMVDGSVRGLRDEVAPFARLAATHGVAFVTGNHEYYHGAAAWQAEARRLGMRVLHNQHLVVERDGARLVVGGVPDVEGARFAEGHAPDAQAAFAGAPDGPRLLLAHQPRFARKAQGLGVQLMLSGHTHGGQIIPFRYLVRLQQPVLEGLAVISGVPVYTSAGTGYWGPPFRVGTRGEVTLLTLRAGSDKTPSAR